MFWSDAWLYHDLYISPLTDAMHAHCTILKMSKKKVIFFSPGFINLFMCAVLAWGGGFKVVLSLVLFQHSCVFISRLTSPAPGGVSDIPTILLPSSSYSGWRPLVLGLLPCLDHLSLFLPLIGFVSIKAMVEGKALIGYKVLVSRFSLLYFGPHPSCFFFFFCHVCGWSYEASLCCKIALRDCPKQRIPEHWGASSKFLLRLSPYFEV